MKKNNTKTFDGKQKSLIMRKSAFCNCAADQRLCFPYTDCTIPLIHKSKCQAFSHLLWLYSSVCVGLGRKPRRPIFSQQGSNTGSIFLAHLSQRLIGELIGYSWSGVRPSSVRPSSVRPSFVNNFKRLLLQNRLPDQCQILVHTKIQSGFSQKLLC